MFNDEVPFAFNEMLGFSTVDGFAEITECLAEMIKYLANEPSVGLFYVQQHTQNAVPNLINVKNKVEEKSREITFHTEDLEDSIIMVRSMKECGFPIADEMIRDIRKSLTIMSTKQPKKGLISSPSLGFRMGRATSWGPASWGRNTGFVQQEAERTSNYLTTVLKSAKQRAGNLKWPQLDSRELREVKGEKLLPYPSPPLAVTAASTSSSMPDTEGEDFPLSSQIADELQEEEESQVDGSLSGHQLLSFSDNFDEFRANREAQLEEWLGGTGNQDGHTRGTDAEKL